MVIDSTPCRFKCGEIFLFSVNNKPPSRFVTMVTVTCLSLAFYSESSLCLPAPSLIYVYVYVYSRGSAKCGRVVSTGETEVGLRHASTIAWLSQWNCIRFPSERCPRVSAATTPRDPAMVGELHWSSILPRCNGRKSWHLWLHGRHVVQLTGRVVGAWATQRTAGHLERAVGFPAMMGY